MQLNESFLSGIYESGEQQVRDDSFDVVIENNNEISENTPLLDYPQRRRRFLNSTLVILVLSILLIGVCISIYLLVLQKRSDNILPPTIDDGQETVNKSGLPNTYKLLTLPPQQSNAKRLVITQTNTDKCDNEVACNKLLQEMEEKSGGENSTYYNFLVSSNGLIYEPVGRKPSPLIKQDSSSSIIVAFIGDYKNTHPSAAQMNALKNLLDNSMSKKDSDASFKLMSRLLNA